MTHETIYQALYVQGRGELRRELAKGLRTGRAVRKSHRQPDQRRSRFQAPMLMISDRPAEVEDRAVPGHWEGDLIIGANQQSAIGTLVERSTRYVLLAHLPNGHAAEQVRDALVSTMLTMPAQLRRSLTWDQGAEMGAHHLITIDADLPIYFCDPASPWQRGSNENTNGLLEWSRKLDTEITCPSSEESSMYSRSTLSHRDAVSAVELFEEGFTAKSVALSLDLARTLFKCCISDGSYGGRVRW